MSDAILRARPPRSGWIPWVFVGGMALVIVVNLVLVWFALTTFTGVTVGHAYDRGRTYNAVIEAAARQELLGWRAQVALEGERLTVVVNDRDGRPVDGRLEGELLRPLEGSTLPVTFSALGHGRYAATVAPGRLGQWEARLSLTSAQGERLDIRQRVIVR